MGKSQSRISKEKRREYNKKYFDKPIGCKYPNCFECIFNDCGYNGKPGEMVDSEVLYELSRRIK